MPPRNFGFPQTYLRDWYGITYQPKIAPETAVQIQLLETLPRAISSTRFSSRHSAATITACSTR
jgi:hypothetical protein